MTSRPGARGPTIAATVLVVLTVVALTACGSGSGSGSARRTPRRTSPPTTSPVLAPTTPSTTPAPATTATVAAFGSGGTPEEAIAAYIRTLPQSPAYAGDCAATDASRDIAKYCSALVSPATDHRTYNIGPTFSEMSERLTVERIGTTWFVTAHAPAPAPGA